MLYFLSAGLEKQHFEWISTRVVLDVPDTGCTFAWDQRPITLVLKVNLIYRNQRQISFSAILKKKDFVKLPPNFVKLHSHQIWCHETEDVHFFAWNKHSTELAEKETLCQKLSPLFWCSDQIICLRHVSHFVGIVKESQYHQFNHYLVIWYAVYTFWYSSSRSSFLPQVIYK